jgi:DNA-binding PucR family transcriptional regulator
MRAERRELLHWDRALTAFDELGLLRVLAHVDDVRRMRELMLDQLGPLLDHEARKGGELVRTLSTFLEHGGAHRPTSEALNIHRNTLKYRLGRIREITSLDPSAANTAFDLQVATRIWQTMSVLGATAPADVHPR